MWRTYRSTSTLTGGRKEQQREDEEGSDPLLSTAAEKMSVVRVTF